MFDSFIQNFIFSAFCFSAILVLLYYPLMIFGGIILIFIQYIALALMFIFKTFSYLLKICVNIVIYILTLSHLNKTKEEQC